MPSKSRAVSASAKYRQMFEATLGHMLRSFPQIATMDGFSKLGIRRIIVKPRVHNIVTTEAE